MPSEWDLRPAPALTRSRRRNRGTAAWCWPPVEALLGKAHAGDPGADRGVHAQYAASDGGGGGRLVHAQYVAGDGGGRGVHAQYMSGNGGARRTRYPGAVHGRRRRRRRSGGGRGVRAQYMAGDSGAIASARMRRPGDSGRWGGTDDVAVRECAKRSSARASVVSVSSPRSCNICCQFETVQTVETKLCKPLIAVWF